MLLEDEEPLRLRDFPDDAEEDSELLLDLRSLLLDEDRLERLAAILGPPGGAPLVVGSAGGAVGAPRPGALALAAALDPLAPLGESDALDPLAPLGDTDDAGAAATAGARATVSGLLDERLLVGPNRVNFLVSLSWKGFVLGN